MDRRTKSPHTIILYKDSEQVGNLSIPHTDPRFVGKEDIFVLAMEKILSVQNGESYNRRSTDPVAGSWDTFEVSWFGFPVYGSSSGMMLTEAA